MDLKKEVQAVIGGSEYALTVSLVAQIVGERLHDEIKDILNEMVKTEGLEIVHGGGGYSTYYKAPKLKRRF